jgi:ATP-grasp ribosomal peptide maturase
VLVITQADDMTADAVIRELNSRSVPIVRFDSADFPENLAMVAEVGGGRRLSGRLATATRTADLANVRSLYYRRPSNFSFPGLSTQDARFATVQARYGLGGVLTSLPGCLYVNHPHAIADAEFKPAQLSAAVALGFDVPPTLITNDPREARRFMSRHERVVYKALGANRYEVDGKSATVWAGEVSSADIDDRVTVTAHLFQEMVEKKWDLRVTVAGEKMFFVRINSPLLDWRRDYNQARYRVMREPAGLARRIRSYLAHFRLASGCFDFAISQDDRPVFLECNPNGQWAWLEPETGLPISAAFADLLEKGLS